MSNLKPDFESTPMQAIANNQLGFTLVEMAVVLFIFGLLIAGLLGPLETQLEARDRQETIDSMEDIIDALYGYAITHGRLPCPDSDGDGSPDMTNEPFDPSDSTTGDCDGGSDFTDGEGFLPWVELNVAQGDAWGNRFRYRVRWPHFTWPDADGLCDGDDNDTAAAGNQAPFEFDMCSSGDISVQIRGDDPGTGAVETKAAFDVAANLPAVVISHGRNGFGAMSTTGIARPTAPAGTDEAENADGDTRIFGRSYAAGDGTCSDDSSPPLAFCAFDDIVKWVSPALLNNRMVSAGRLP